MDSSIVKRTIRRTVVSGAGPIDDDVDIKHVRTYQVYRGMSPTTSSRLEIRLKELEDSLEREREGRIRAEKHLAELGFEFDGMADRLDEADGLTAQHIEIARRREADLAKVKKDLELMTVQYESLEASLRKRHQEALRDLQDQLDYSNKSRAKAEKDKQTLVIEIDSLSSLLDAANKAKAHAEAKVGGLEDSLRHMKTQNDELLRVNNDLNNLKARLSQENFELHRQVQELDSANGVLSKAKSTLQIQLDDAKNRLDEETRQRNQLTIQLTNLQVDFDNLNARLEEETANGESLRTQLSHLQADYTLLKSRYDKDLLSATEALEELRRKMTSRIAELEDALEQARSRASKLEKEKNRLQIEIRDLSVQLEAANANLNDMAARLKRVEGLNIELQRRVDELTAELQNARGEVQRLNAELGRLRLALTELQEKNDGLARENKQLLKPCVRLRARTRT